MTEFSSPETQAALADLAEPAEAECTDQTHDHSTSSCLGPAVPAVHPLAAFSTREMLDAVRARAIVIGGMDGRHLADTIRAWLEYPGARLGDHLLDMRAVDMANIPMPTWQTRLVAAQDGYFTASSCTPACLGVHTTPQQALACTASADE